MSLPVVSVEVMFNGTLTGSTTRTNTFDGGTSGGTLTTGNSGAVSGDSFTGATGSPRYSSAQAHGAGLSVFNASAGVDTHIDWSGVAQPGDVFCARLYLYLVSAPSGSQRVVVLLGPGGVMSALWLFADRTIRVYLGFTTSVAATFATPIPVGQWVRIELRYTINGAGSGTVELWLYTNPDSATHTAYAISGTLAWPNGPKPQAVEWHLQRDAGGYWHTDDVAVADTKIGSVGTWTNVTSWGKRGIATQRGSQRIQSPIIRYEAGQATVHLENTDRRFDPTNLSGPYVSSGRSQVTPMRPLRIRAVWASVIYDLFRGFVDVWDVDWVADVYSEVIVRATDGFKVLRNRRRAAVAPVGAGENTGARVTRVLNSAGWPAADRVIATGNSTLQATDLEGDSLSELQDSAESEIGELYIDGAGRIVFRSRNAMLLETRSNTVQATFGDPAGSYAPYEARLNSDDATLWNEVKAKRVGGAELVVGDAASQAEFLTRTFQPPDLLVETDTEVEAYAGWILYVSKEPEVRFDTLVVHAHALPATLFPTVLGREIGDRIRIVRRPSGGGTAIVRDVFIRGISHTTTGATWITTWTLQSASKYGSFFTLDNPTLGLLDFNALAY